jgi:ribose transport system substrate-binding protein
VAVQEARREGQRRRDARHRGVPADTDRHKGFQQALKKYPGIKVVKQTFTQWSFAPGGKQMLDILNSGVQVDGVWTSGSTTRS